MNKTWRTLLFATVLVGGLTNGIDACTSFVLKAQDGSPVYGRTMEWGLSDLKSNLVLVPRHYTNITQLDNGQPGMSWTTKYGFVAINAMNLPYYSDGMNETGLTVGGLYLPGFTQYQNIDDRTKDFISPS